MLFLLSLVCVFATLWPLWDTASFPAELLGQFRLQITACYIFVLLSCIWRRKMLAGFIAFGLILFNLYWMHTSFAIVSKSQSAIRSDARFRILSFNIYKENGGADAVASVIRQADPDIVFLMEVNGPMLQKLKNALLQPYPFHFAVSDAPDHLNWVLFSKYPMKAEKQRLEEGDMQKVLFADIAYPGQEIQFLGAHMLSPRNKERIGIRNAQLDRLARHITEKIDLAKPIIVAGDMNTAPWQRSLRDFQNVTRLSNSGSLAEMVVTWPSWLPVVGLPIDHIMHNSRFCGSDKYRLMASGSDHYPIYADLYLCANSAPASAQ